MMMSLKEKLEEIHKSIVTKEEVRELASAFKKKVEDVLKVVKRNVSVEKVSQHRIVEG